MKNRKHAKYEQKNVEEHETWKQKSSSSPFEMLLFIFDDGDDAVVAAASKIFKILFDLEPPFCKVASGLFACFGCSC